jgi:hypothetical protein
MPTQAVGTGVVALYNDLLRKLLSAEHMHGECK